MVIGVKPQPLGALNFAGPQMSGNWKHLLLPLSLCPAPFLHSVLEILWLGLDCISPEKARKMTGTSSPYMGVVIILLAAFMGASVYHVQPTLDALIL